LTLDKWQLERTSGFRKGAPEPLGQWYGMLDVQQQQQQRVVVWGGRDDKHMHIPESRSKAHSSSYTLPRLLVMLCSNS